MAERYGHVRKLAVIVPLACVATVIGIPATTSAVAAAPVAASSATTSITAPRPRPRPFPQRLRRRRPPLRPRRRRPPGGAPGQRRRLRYRPTLPVRQRSRKASRVPRRRGAWQLGATSPQPGRARGYSTSGATAPGPRPGPPSPATPVPTPLRWSMPSRARPSDRASRSEGTITLPSFGAACCSHCRAGSGLQCPLRCRPRSARERTQRCCPSPARRWATALPPGAIPTAAMMSPKGSSTDRMRPRGLPRMRPCPQTPVPSRTAGSTGCRARLRTCAVRSGLMWTRRAPGCSPSTPSPARPGAPPELPAG